MNNSDPTLTTSEEKLIAYIDGRLSAEEAAAFERENPEAIHERDDALRLAQALKRGSKAPPLRNPDFFNRQILREIAAQAGGKPAAAAGEKPSLFNLWRLAFAGAFCLLLATGIYHGMVTPPSAPPAPPYVAEVLSVKTGDSSLSTRLIREEGLTLVMIDGLEPMSEEFILN